ncbi:hypothetical protein ACQJBY_008709 [Aegilops geniculata]
MSPAVASSSTPRSRFRPSGLGSSPMKKFSTPPSYLYHSRSRPTIGELGGGAEGERQYIGARVLALGVVCPYPAPCCDLESHHAVGAHREQLRLLRWGSGCRGW